MLSRLLIDHCICRITRAGTSTTLLRRSSSSLNVLSSTNSTSLVSRLITRSTTLSSVSLMPQSFPLPQVHLTHLQGLLTTSNCPTFHSMLPQHLLALRGYPHQCFWFCSQSGRPHPVLRCRAFCNLSHDLQGCGYGELQADCDLHRLLSHG